MTVKANAVRTLYHAKRITIDGVRKAVKDGVISPAEYKDITEKEYE